MRSGKWRRRRTGATSLPRLVMKDRVYLGCAQA